MADFLDEVRYAFRILWKSPGFTAIAVAALALGIGANTAIFTVVNAVLLEPLPYPHPERLMRIERQFPNGHAESISIPKYMTWRNNDVFESMTLYEQGAIAMNFGSGDPPIPVNVIHVSGEFFNVFGILPSEGRAFTPSEDIPQGPPVAVISDSIRRVRFGDVEAIGRAILLNGSPYSIVGVLPASFHADPEADIWIPLQADPDSTNQGHVFLLAGRLKPNATLASARSAIKIAGERFRSLNPKWMGKNESVAVVPLREAIVGDIRPALLILSGAVALVLLIACTNVANLLLTRAAGRQREIAIRAAIGAKRSHIVRQLLCESALLAGIGGVLGFGLGAWGVRVLLNFVPGNIPRLTDPRGAPAALPIFDWRVALFTITIAGITVILFGLFPALRVSNPDLSSMLKESSSRSGTGWKQNRTRAALVISEVAIAVVLLIGASLLIRSFAALHSLNPGFDTQNTFTMQTGMASANYNSTAKIANFVTQVLRRMENIPGVEGATSAVILPEQGGIDLPFTIAGRPPAQGDYNGDEQWRSISPHYFQVLRIPILRGRAFNDGDVGGSTKVVVINEAMAKKYWPNEDAIGQVITIGKGLGPQFNEPPRQVIGIVGNVRELLAMRLERGGNPRADIGVMYIPQTQVTDGLTNLLSALPLSWMVRTHGEPMALRSAIERELHSIDALIPISRERTMEQVMAETFARQAFNALLLAVFAAIALALAAIGIYGLMAYSVEQRTSEIGIRMALGAGSAQILKLILGQGMRMAAAGVVVGLIAAYAASRVLISLLFGVKPTDPSTFGLVAMILAAVALIANLVPARKATVIEPLEALRYE